MNTPKATPGTVRSRLHPVLQELLHRLDVRFCEPRKLWSMTGRPFPCGVGGLWEPAYDVISLTDDAAEEGWLDHYCLHEITHWTGHPDRLNRKAIAIGMRHGQIPSAVLFDTEEATAQLGMYKLSVKLGFDEAKAKIHLEEYLMQLPHAQLAQADKDAEAAVVYILEKAFGYAEQKIA